MVTANEIKESFPQWIDGLIGTSTASAKTPCSMENPKSNGLVFVPDIDSTKNSFAAGASLVVIPEKLFKSNENELKDLPKDGQCLLTSSNIHVAMAQINARYFPIDFNRKSFDGHKVHSSAVISESAKIGADVVVGPNAVIGENTVIARACVIGPNATIENNCTIGEETHIHGNTFVAHNSLIGNRCVIQSNTSIGSIGYGYASDEEAKHYHKPHYGRVILKDDVEIGSGCFIDRGAFEDTVIGECTKIDNKCHIAHNNIIGKSCLITAGFISAGSTTIGDRCSFAGRCSVGGHITICSDCTFTGVSVVSGNVTEPGIYGGWPLTDHKKNLRVMMSMTHLPEIRKSVSKLLKHLNIK